MHQCEETYQAQVIHPTDASYVVLKLPCGDVSDESFGWDG
jgi:hypothetical protein